MKFIIIFLTFLGFSYSECYELGQAECVQYPDYCNWNEETNSCDDNYGGSGVTGGGDSNGTFQYSTITESQGLRNGPNYRDGVVYFPISGNPPYKSIVLTPGYGGASSEMSSWAEFYASHGFISMRIGPNDEVNDSHEDRGEGLLDGIESIRQENSRIGSPLEGLIDMDSFSVSGYSMGGGASHNAAMIDENSIQTIISLNPTVLFEDCDLCPANSYEGEIYCICLVPELVSHSVPSLIFAGEIEINELEFYGGLLGQDIYQNMRSDVDKIMFEGAGAGHGFAANPYGDVANYALNWLKYQILDDNNAYDLLLEVPSSASEYLTNLTYSAPFLGDLNDDSLVNVQDIILAVNLILNSEYNNLADLNSDGNIDILDIVQLVNIILTSITRTTYPA
jgi:hypothetical protein